MRRAELLETVRNLIVEMRSNRTACSLAARFNPGPIAQPWIDVADRFLFAEHELRNILSQLKNSIDEFTAQDSGMKHSLDLDERQVCMIAPFDLAAEPGGMAPEKIGIYKLRHDGSWWLVATFDLWGNNPAEAGFVPLFKVSILGKQDQSPNKEGKLDA